MAMIYGSSIKRKRSKTPSPPKNQKKRKFEIVTLPPDFSFIDMTLNVFFSSEDDRFIFFIFYLIYNCFSQKKIIRLFFFALF